MSKNNITTPLLEQFENHFRSAPQYRIGQNALSKVDAKLLSMNFARFSQTNHIFSDVVEGELPITYQQKSGRCWIFAALNMLRIPFAKTHKLEKFEFSQNYLFFWDKLEKANYFLENIINTGSESYDSRLLMFLLHNPVQDGGQWHMFVSLVNKYGLVPKSVFPDTEGAANSQLMNYYLTLKLRENAAKLRDLLSKGVKPTEIQKIKVEMLQEIHRMLSMQLGTPPTKFTWEYYSKDKKFHRMEGLTPKIFYEKYVKGNLDDYICLVDSPRKHTPYYKSYTVAYLGNVIEGTPVTYVNVPIEELKLYTMKMIQKHEPVWHGCDVSKCFNREKGIMDLKLYDLDLLYDVSFNMTKEMRMNYGESQMTHAMLFTGVDIEHNRPIKWRVENSWGEGAGEKGMFLMTDEWFNEYMFEVAIHKDYLPKKLIEIAKDPPIVLPPWDPLGSLA